jgi:ABC-type Fe3+/spermidine/putrescine transport system ATPase subunit
MKIVKLQSISKSYGGIPALKKVSLEIEEGERIVILGPSGCGKTTFLRMVAGFLAPDSGSLSIEGEIVARDGRIVKPPEQRGLGMVFQDLALWPHLSVKGNIDFGLKAKGLPRKERQQRIREMLDLVGLAGQEHRKPSDLSGGQQQRVALARALVLEPRILLMDEPLSSLDQELNIRMRKEILRLQKKSGVTLLYVTHNPAEASDIATQIISMKNGRIEEQ